MKISKYLILFGFIAALFGTSCNDYLERTPESVINEGEAFKNFHNFQGFVEEMYMYMPNMLRHTWVSTCNFGEDEMVSSGNPARYLGTHIDRGNFRWHINAGECFLDRSSWSSDENFQNKDIWNSAWYCIRKANMGLEALENGLFVDGTDEERDLLAGQCYFHRAWWHFKLMIWWGGMPYIDRVLSSNETLNLPRLSFRECGELVAEDFRKAAGLLPINWDKTTRGQQTLNNNELRVNKIWALGYLGKTLLWMGSPLIENGPGGAKTYNQEYCKKAADVLGELLDLVEKDETQYALATLTDTGDDFENINFGEYLSLFRTYRESWRMPGRNEAIVRNPNYGANARYRQNQVYMPQTMCDGDNSVLCPTANYVNLFGMKNGLPLTDPASGFDETHPWKGRDPRFYANFMYDGLRVVRGSLNAEQQTLWRWANLHTGGSWVDASVSGSSNSLSLTGYCLRKFITLSCNNLGDNDHGGNGQVHMLISYLRLADVYLMYAEAAAQGYGGTNGASPKISGLTAVGAVNKIRARVGVDPVDSKFLTSTDEFMKELRRERAVELSFEGHRFHDLRRWLLLTEPEYLIKTRQDFDRVGAWNSDANPRERQVANWRETVIVQRNFDNKHYWLPIKDSQVYLYEGFDQNPDW